MAKRKLFPVLIISLVSFISSPSLFSQITTADNTEPDIDQFHFSFWGGYSFNSIRFLGKTPDSQTTILGIGIKKKLKDYSDGKSLYYSADVIPYLQYDYPKRDEAGKRTEVSGFGVSPVGFFISKPFSDNIFPFIQATGGLIYMEQMFPTDLARRLNYTFDVTIGASLQFMRQNAFTVGYKFHHISNAQTGYENPGLDSNFLFFSFSL